MKRELLAAASIVALGALVVTPAEAQTAAAPASGQAPAAVEEVVVTGSRVARVGFVAPTPVTAVSADQLKQANPGTIGDALRQLPILSASSGPRGATGSSGSGGSFLNLRRLGGPRTLTLLDGRRYVPSGSEGTVDTALFPQNLVSRVEIVTGGASAAYGSDAVAGVVNFILDKDFTGVKGELMAGIAGEGDMPERKANIAYGASFGGDRGHLLASAEVFSNAGLYDLLQRRTGRRSCSVIAAPTGSPTARMFACDVRSSNANFGGLISTGPLSGTTFDTNSNPIPFNFGTYRTSTTQVGGDGVLTQFLPLAVPIERASLFTRATWDLTDTTSAFIEANYGAAEYEYQIGSYSQAIGSTALTIFRDNAYLTPAMRARMVSANVTNFRLGRFSRDLPRTWISNLNYTTRVVGGLQGETRGVKWSGYYEHGENRQSLDAEYDQNLDRYQEASDAVLAPNGQIVCRSTLTNPLNGCVPINVLGEHTPTAQQLAYITGTNWSTTKSMQDTLALEGNAEPFSLPAGPVSLAGGLEYRKQSIASKADPTSAKYSVISDAPGPYRVGNYLPQKGEFDVREAFVEAVVPLAKDMPFLQELDFNGAVRRTYYSTSGGVTTWKAGLTWRPAEFIRFRGTRSRDIRAPNLSELFNAGTTSHSPTFLDQFYNPPRTLNQVLNIARGNPDLKPEEADTLTFGVVITPTFISNLDISVDAYDIEIAGAIATVAASQSTLDCRNGATASCSRVDRDANGNVTTTYTVPENLQSRKAAGVDFEVAYRFDVSSLYEPVPGTVSLRFLGNYVSESYTVAPGAIIVDRTGDSSQPEWRWTFSSAYRNGPFNLSTQARYSGQGPFDSTTAANDLPQRDIPGQVIVDGRVSYDFKAMGADLTAYLNVQNILNRLPPIFANAEQFDPIGRYFRMGVTFRY